METDFGLTHLNLAQDSAVIAGAAAGDLTVTGIRFLPTDALVMVQRIDAAGANLVGEFEITAADTINNAGGTDTTGFLLLVKWNRANPVGGPDLGRV